MVFVVAVAAEAVIFVMLGVVFVGTPVNCVPTSTCWGVIVCIPGPPIVCFGSVCWGVVVRCGCVSPGIVGVDGAVVVVVVVVVVHGIGDGVVIFDGDVTLCNGNNNSPSADVVIVDDVAEGNCCCDDDDGIVVDDDCDDCSDGCDGCDGGGGCIFEGKNVLLFSCEMVFDSDFIVG